MNLRSRRRKGLSLLELLITIVILTATLMAFAMVFPSGFHLLTQTRMRSQAASLANGFIQKVQNVPFAGDPGNSDAVTLENLQSWSATEKPYSDFFEIPDKDKSNFSLQNAENGNPKSIDVKILDSNSGYSLARISVTVYWRDKNYRLQPVTITTYRSSNH
jgi:type II secretory pathway pseudopilin PulG